jgi:DNA-binding PadR family transcriptional regulator
MHGRNLMRHSHHVRGRGPREQLAFGYGPGFGNPFGPGFGGPGFGGPGFGGPGPRGRGRRHGGPGGRAGRGDVRAAVLLLLAEGPKHGYQLIKLIEERSGGQWRPSPGAVYPALNLLQDEGLVAISSEGGGRRLAALTETGHSYIAKHSEELGDPWAEAASRGPRHGQELREATGSVVAAVQQVAMSGSSEQAAEAVALLERTRRELYLILAGAPSDAAPSDAPQAGDAS